MVLAFSCLQRGAGLGPVVGGFAGIAHFADQRAHVYPRLPLCRTCATCLLSAIAEGPPLAAISCVPRLSLWCARFRPIFPFDQFHRGGRQPVSILPGVFSFFVARLRLDPFSALLSRAAKLRGCASPAGACPAATIGRALPMDRDHHLRTLLAEPVP